MKKLFAILMIAIHLFNLAGYKLLFGYYILQSDKNTVQRLDDNQYSDSDLVEVKVRLNLPYMTALNNYERFDGEIKVNGEYYKYVKRKISNDTLYLLCLPDYYKGELSRGKTEYASTANELQAGNQEKDAGAGNIKKELSAGEYVCQMAQPETKVYHILINKFEAIASTLLTDTYITSEGQPPESAA